jgi:hypothetical protein
MKPIPLIGSYGRGYWGPEHSHVKHLKLVIPLSQNVIVPGCAQRLRCIRWNGCAVMPVVRSSPPKAPEGVGEEKYDATARP